MFIACRNYLVEKLKQSGIRMTPVTSMKKLERYPDPHVGAVLFESEAYEKDGSKVVHRETGQQRKRRKIYKRDTTFCVIIGDPNPDKVENILSAFLESLDDGIHINGNYTELAAAEAAWVDDDDSILKSRLAVNLKVVFTGGVYKDTGFAPVKHIEVTSVRKGEDT